ncbi:MAG: uroporphyrinogen decarboxylase [Verrucomicrobiales bacterium]
MAKSLINLEEHTPNSPRPAAGLARSTRPTWRERFANACHCRKNDRPPIWMMRQAGRALPEYRQLKEKYSFLEMVRTPELAAEVTLQPIRRFGFDAAILFSDILVIPEAMGQSYRFRDTGGIEMDFIISNAADVDRLRVDGVAERLQYVSEALKAIRALLGEDRALIGFSGAPWTLANFMLEGGGSKTPTKALELYQSDPALFERLMEKLSSAVIEYLRMQQNTGVDALQIFDTHAGLIPENDFENCSGRWIRQIVQALDRKTPAIVFCKGVRQWSQLEKTGANVLGVDHGISMAKAREGVSDAVALQGNLNPELLTFANLTHVESSTRGILEEMRGGPGHIFNLGHGVTPEARLDNIATVVETVQEWKA